MFPGDANMLLRLWAGLAELAESGNPPGHAQAEDVADPRAAPVATFQPHYLGKHLR